MKICSRCKKEKPLTDFFKQSVNRGGGFRSECKTCHNAWSRGYARRNPDKIRAASRKYRYGITEPEYSAFWARQNGCCAICSISSKELDVDHSHGSGVVRGLLCRQCNQAIGLFKESIAVLDSAKSYLCKFLPLQ